MTLLPGVPRYCFRTYRLTELNSTVLEPGFPRKSILPRSTASACDFRMALRSALDADDGIVCGFNENASGEVRGYAAGMMCVVSKNVSENTDVLRGGLGKSGNMILFGSGSRGTHGRGSNSRLLFSEVGDTLAMKYSALYQLIRFRLVTV